MNESSPGILILGGGVAGMSAALALSNRDVRVHLVEKQDRLGGNTANWACMATGLCQNCGACLGPEMADQLKHADNISIHLNTQITSLDRTEQGLAASLSSGITLTAAKAVLATGFTPFDPSAIPSYHTHTLEKVITTAQLNTLLREDRLAPVMGKAPKIAFLQCVGSRDREQNRDYCSQVCCKISMRHAKKIQYLIPDADISLFYMDLQIIGKETRAMADQLSTEIRLIQGVPAEILEDRETGRLTMVTEDPATLSRRSAEFDLVVLSVGMTAGEEGSGLSKILGTTPNSWGFFNTPEADPGKEIYVAGCARGPGDILSAVQDGRIAAAKILKDLDISVRPKTGIAVLGSGPQAAAVTRAVAGQGYEATVFNLGDAKILSINGTMDNFSIRYQDQNKKQTLTCGAVIAAPEPGNQSHSGNFKGAVSLAAFTALAPQHRPDNSLMLLDHYGPESKADARQALLAAMETRKAGRQVDVLMNKMLVHGPDGQQLYDQARKSGIRFLRYETPSDITIKATDKGLEISLKEATLPGIDLVLSPATLVVPDTTAPGPEFAELARLLKLGLDLEGFLQPANVRHRLVQSQRKGIYFAGPCHDDIDKADLDLEIRAILADLENRPPPVQARVWINEKKCAKCLTCHRVCPHGAIILNEKQRPQIMDGACFECQACLSNCPAYAIECQGLANTDLAAQAKKGRTLIYACERSAALAAEGLPPDTDLISIPCACRISADVLLRALVRGADRIIVSGCHDGNCRSGEGGAIARQGVEAVLALPGIQTEKVAWKAVAANEPGIFTKTISGTQPGKGTIS